MKKEKNIHKAKEDNIPISIRFSAAALFLLGVLVLVFQTPDLFVLEYNSVVMALASVSLIIAGIGVWRMRLWGLRFQALSMVLPIIAFFIKDGAPLFSTFGILDLLIFIYLILVYKAHYCLDKEKRQRLQRMCKRYCIIVVVLLLTLLLVFIFGMFSCAALRSVNFCCIGISRAIAKAFELKQ